MIQLDTDAVAALKAKIGDRVVVASLSTGKDSVALSLFLTEHDIEHERIFLDTAWEHPAVAEHLEYLRGKLGPIRALSGPLGMVELIRKKGMFPSRARRFCTEELKTFPARDYLNARMDAGDDVVNAVGIRRGESDARKTSSEWEWMQDWDCEVWRPLVDWTVGDVIAIHKRHDIKPNKLYLMGFDRVGCFPCINSNKGEVRKIADMAPEKIDEIRELELEVNVKARARYDARLARYTAGGPTALSKRDAKLLLTESGSVKPFSLPTSSRVRSRRRAAPHGRLTAWLRGHAPSLAVASRIAKPICFPSVASTMGA